MSASICECRCFVLALLWTLACQAAVSDVSLSGDMESGSSDETSALVSGTRVSELAADILYVFQARDETYWFGSSSAGVFRYDGTTLTQFTTKDGLAADQIRGIQEDKAGHIYITTYKGISRFDGREFTLLPVATDTQMNDWKLEPDDLWFVDGPTSGAVYRFDGTSLHRLKLPKTAIAEAGDAGIPPTIAPESRWSSNDVYTIFKDRQGHVWFGTGGAGACCYDGKSLRWLYEKHLTDTPEGGSFGIRSILEDKTGHFWICNTRFRFQPDFSSQPETMSSPLQYKCEPGITNVKALDGLDHFYFMSVVEDADGALWMATYGMGVWRYDGTKVTHLPVMDAGEAITVFGIYQDNAGQLWLGTHEHGAYRFDGKAFERVKL